jgi:hypothetical protein
MRRLRAREATRRAIIQCCLADTVLIAIFGVWDMPRFTVLLPAHNRADVIGYSIRSILAQTEADYELFVVGDGCTDGTAEVVAAFSDPRVRWFDLPKAPAGGYANRNIALREATGELIAYAQHDDLMLPDHLQRLGQAMKPGIGWAYSRPLWVSTDGILVPYGTDLTIPDELTFFLNVGNTIPSNCVVHRRECLDQAGYWPEHGIADWTLWRTIIRHLGAERIAYVPVGTALHFSAIWKNSRHSGVPEVLHWLQSIDDTGWWPAVLQQSVPGQEQRVWYEALEAGGAPFVAALREAVDKVIDRQAWRSIMHTAPLVRELKDAQQAASAHAASIETQLRDMHARHEAARAKATTLEAHLTQAQAQCETALATVSALEERLRAAQAHLTDSETALLQSHAAADDLAEQLRASRAESADHRQQLDAMLASRSWRVLEPTRRLVRFLRR